MSVMPLYLEIRVEPVKPAPRSLKLKPFRSPKQIQADERAKMASWPVKRPNPWWFRFLKAGRRLTRC